MIGRLLLVSLLCLSAGTAFSETYLSLRTTIDRSCTPCHAVSARFQIIDFPFASNVYPSQEDVVKTMIERATRAIDEQGTMPPKGASYPRLNDEEISRLSAWLDAGLPRE